MLQKKIYIFVFLILLFNAFYPDSLQMTKAAENGNESVEEWISKQVQKENPLPDLEENNSQSKDEQVGITAGDVIRSILALLFVIGLLLFVLKWLQKKTASISETDIVKNLGGTSVGNNRSIQLIKIGNRILIVGVGEDVTLLKEMTDAEEVDNILNEYKKQFRDVPEAMDIFKRFTKLTKNKNDRTDQSFQEEFKKQLNDIVRQRKETLAKGKEKEWDSHG